MLLEFALGDAESFVFVVRKGGVKRLVKIPVGREELAAKVKAFMEPLINRDPDRFSLAQAHELYSLLLAQALKEVKEDEGVIIVPDGILGLLPFEALVLKPGTGLKDSVFLGDRYTLTYYQSAAVMALKRTLQVHRAGRPLFALGNPVFSAQDPRVAPVPPEGPGPPAEVRGAKEAPFRALAASQEWGKTTRDAQNRPGVGVSGPAGNRRLRSWPSPGCLRLSPGPRTCSWTSRPMRPACGNPLYKIIATSISPPTPTSPGGSRASGSHSCSWARWGMKAGTTASSP